MKKRPAPRVFPKSLAETKEGFKILMWDIECWSFKADEGLLMLSGFKELGKKPYVLINKNLGVPGKHLDDKELCLQTKIQLESADIIVTYYGLGFDLKYLNSKLLYWGIEPVKPKLHIDLYRLGKKYWATSRRSLDVITNYLGIKGKTHLKLKEWREMAWEGNKEAIEEGVDHCSWDVIITEKLFYRLKPLLKSISLA